MEFGILALRIYTWVFFFSQLGTLFLFSVERILRNFDLGVVLFFVLFFCFFLFVFAVGDFGKSELGVYLEIGDFYFPAFKGLMKCLIGFDEMRNL